MTERLSPAGRAQVAKFVVDNDDSWIPEEFKEAIKDAREGRFVEMETALIHQETQAMSEPPYVGSYF